jgi:Ser/Thr protein kinase RdoA (MazF antagonist)
VLRTFRSLVDPAGLCRLVADAYGLQVTGCVLLRSLVNDVYRVDTAEGPHALKLYRAGHRTVDEVAWEVALAGALGGAVTPGVPLSDGRGAGVAETAEGVRPYALWQWAPGGPPQAPFDDDLYRRYGRAAAGFHAACDRVDLPPRRFDVMDALGWPLDQVLERVGDGDRALITALVAEATARLGGMTLDAGICHGDVSLDNLHVDGDRIVFYDLDRAGNGWRATDLTGVASTPHWPAFLEGYRAVRDFGDEAAIPWLGIVDRIGNLHFHLVDKPAMRGTESLGEGWVDRNLTALREAARAV